MIHSGSYGYVEDKPHFHLDLYNAVLDWPTTPKTHPKYGDTVLRLMGRWCDNQGYGLFIKARLFGDANKW